jgi:hypothetical protein
MRFMTFAAALMIAGLAQAHEAIGPNGGRLVDAGNLHVELVPKGKSVDVFVTDANDKPLRVEGYKGTAVLVVDGKPQRIQLAPGGENRLTGAATIDVPATASSAAMTLNPIPVRCHPVSRPVSSAFNSPGSAVMK